MAENRSQSELELMCSVLFGEKSMRKIIKILSKLWVDEKRRSFRISCDAHASRMICGFYLVKISADAETQCNEISRSPHEDFKKASRNEEGKVKEEE